MFKYLTRLDRRWPVEVALGDVGHSRAQNKPATWQRLNAQAFQWLQSNIGESREQRTVVSSEETVCGDSAGSPQAVVGTSPEDLASGTLTVRFGPGGTQGDAALADKNGPATDAMAGEVVQPRGSCRHSDGPAVGGYTAYSPPRQSTTTYVGIGVVRVPHVWTGGGSSLLAARLFDAAPDGSELLTTRGVYRFEDDPLTGTIHALLREPLAPRAGTPNPAGPDAGRQPDLPEEQHPEQLPVPERRDAHPADPPGPLRQTSRNGG